MSKPDRTPIGTFAHYARHWHYVRHRRTRKVNHDTREILIGQMISVCGAIVSGLVLDLNKAQLATMAGAFLILPGVFDLGGSVAGAMSARLNHRLEGGNPIRDVFRDSLIHALSLVAVASIFLGLFGATVGSIFFDASFIKLFFVSTLSTVIAGAVGMPLVGLATLVAAKRGVDADNFIGPIETSIFDTLTVFSVTLMVVIFS